MKNPPTVNGGAVIPIVSTGGGATATAAKTITNGNIQVPQPQR